MNACTLQSGSREWRHHSACPYQVWAFGRLSVFASIRWMVNSRGPAAPVEPYKTTV